MKHLKYFILFVYLLFSSEIVYSRVISDCSAGLSACNSYLANRKIADPSIATSCFCDDFNGQAVGLTGWCNGYIIPKLPDCVKTDSCPAGMPVGADSNDYALMTKGQPYSYGNYSYNGCAVTCSGSSSTVPLSCSQNADQKHAVRGCVYTGDENTSGDCDFGCSNRQLYQATQPAPEDCNGPLGVHWTKAVSGTSRIRGCVCDGGDFVVELAYRCGAKFVEEAGTVILAAIAASKAGAAGGFVGMGAAAGGAAVGVAANSAWELYMSNCEDDPVNPSATNVVNCPYQRVGDKCVIPPDMTTNSAGCPPPTFESFPGSKVCLSADQATVTRDQQSETQETFPDPPAQSSQPTCPSGTTPSQGLCWCTDTGRIYTAKYGCDGNGTTPDEPPPEEPGNTTTNDNNQNQDQGGTGYHVWVDNQSEVYNVLNAIKDKMCGWASKPCQVHTGNGDGTYTTDKVVVENFEQLLEAVNAVNGGVESIRVSASKTEDNTTVIRADIDWMKQDLSVIKTAAEDTQNNTSISKDYLFQIKEDSDALLQNSHDALRLEVDSNYKLEQANYQLEQVNNNVSSSNDYLYSLVQNSNDSIEQLSNANQKLDKLATLDDILEELRRAKPCVECCINVDTPPDNTPPEEEKCVDTAPKDGICDLMYDLTEDIKNALECKDENKDKVCDVLAKEADKPPEEPPVVDVPNYTAGGAGTCPVINLSVNMGPAGTNAIAVDFSENLCKLLSFFGYFFLLSAYYTAARVYYYAAVVPSRAV